MSNRKYSLAFKLDAFRRLQAGKTPPEVARALGIEKGILYGWLRKYKKWKTKPDGPTSIEDTLAAIAASIPLREYRKFEIDEKKRLVQQMLDGTPVAELAEEHDIAAETLYQWRRQYGPELEGKVKMTEGEQKAEIPAKQMSTGDKAADQRSMPEVDHAQGKAEADVEVREMVADPLAWLQKHTQTKDSHWREAGASSCYRSFPDKPHFRPIAEAFRAEPILFIEKSRDMMLSWLCVGLFTHAAMTIPGIEVLFQSQKEEKAFELVGYAKTLYLRQDERIKKAYPLKKWKQPAGILEFAHGSRIIGIPGGGDQIRSYHPWGLFQDEASFMPEAGESYDHAVPVCQKIVAVSSAGPGWFAEQCQSALDVFSPVVPPGVRVRRLADGRPVYRVHYSADPERDRAWVERERKKYSSKGAWDREQEIIHEAGGGERIFAEVLARDEEKILIDPRSSGFRPSSYWRMVGGFDHGKANPTGALVACIDHDGVIYVLGEYYQPGLSPAQHRANLLALNGFSQAEIYADPSIFHQTQAQEDGKYRAIAELYADLGITNLVPAPATHELLGMERILAHWHDLGNREPTLKIVCPREKRDIAKPIYGVHNDGCPNLVWELRRARREELSATQLLVRNPTEKIVDKDNHLRDPLKYLCLALPAPTPRPWEVKVQEAMAGIPLEDVTSRMIRGGPLCFEQAEESPLVGIGLRGRLNARRLERRRR
jgi:transposase-like protein